MNAMLTLAEYPRDNQPYEKLEDLGEAALSDAELLAILLNAGQQGETALDQATRLIAHEGLRYLKDASLAELRQHRGIGRVKALRIKAAIELGKRLYLNEPPAGAIITSPELAIRHIEGKLLDLDHEEFHAIFLDVRKRIIRSECISTGGLTGAMVHPREVFRRALKLNAHAIILCHNHPSGDPSPSTADMEATQRFVDLGRMMGVSVVDHLIVSERGTLSFREEGYL